MESLFLKAINAWFRDNPIGMLIVGIVFYTIWKGIPWLYRWYRKEKKIERAERDKTRDAIGEIKISTAGILTEQKFQKVQFGSIQTALNGHVENKSIHGKH